MKVFVFALCSIALVCSLMSFVEGSVGRENCPENTTPEQCEAYAQAKSKTFNYCHRFVHGGNSLEWQTCGTVSCGGNTILVPEDLSKPYPNCCERCKVVDASKPATISGVA